jgi:GRASP55/65 PDZ-like domain
MKNRADFGLGPFDDAHFCFAISFATRYVYNTDEDKVRVVALMPTYNWGDGRGLLGAEVGTGYLHRLPATSRNTSGTSIERRVRYVNENEAAIEKQDQILEMEPQLEMEPEEAEEEPVFQPNSSSVAAAIATMTTPEKPAPTVRAQNVVESYGAVTTPPAKFQSNFPPPPKPSPQPVELSEPALTHTTSSGSTGPPNKPTRQVSMQPGTSSTPLGPPPQIYHGRQAYTDPKSATTGYKRPSYIMPPSPSVLSESR